MRMALLAGVICLSASAALTAQLQPLNVKTGSWQITAVSSMNIAIPPELQARLNQLPPEQRAQLQSRFGGAPHTSTYNSCITAADLARVPFQRPTDRCTWTTLTSTGSDMQVRGTCQETDNNGTTNVNANLSIHVIDSENATGSMQMSATGNAKMSGTNTLTGKWVGATCTTN
jgi:hypothetical protein